MEAAYKINIVCRNCGHIPMEEYASEVVKMAKKFPVPKGTTIKAALMSMTCENCGCEGYMGLLNQPG